MTQSFRLPRGGGVVDRSRPLAFQFDGRRLEGYAGDTLASALLANGVHLVGRSFKYHRPRGIVSAGAEEPNALIGVERDVARQQPNVRATVQEVFDGAKIVSQNRWPSLSFDVGAVNNLLAPFFAAGDQVAGAVGVTSFARDLTREKRKQAQTALVQLAATISERLGQPRL